MLLFVNSCANMNDGIAVSYLTGCIETSTAISCEEMKKHHGKIQNDTLIYITKNEFERIIELMNSPRTSKTGCDSRMYIQHGSLELCVGDLDCLCDINGNNMTDYDTWIVYQIKCKSGYYNHITQDYLEYDNSIKKYGMPKDYKYLYDNMNLDNKQSFPKHLKRKRYVKVLFKVKTD